MGAADGTGMIESIPLAALAQVEIVSITYRQAPETTFPAASEDVAAVYRELLKTHRPEDIAIFGCSAGGLLAAEVDGLVRQGEAAIARGTRHLLRLGGCALGWGQSRLWAPVCRAPASCDSSEELFRRCRPDQSARLAGPVAGHSSSAFRRRC